MRKGFTTIEVLMILAIMVIVASLSFGGYSIWRRRVVLVNNVSELRSNLTKVQQLSVAAAQNSNWGIHLESDRYTIFQGPFYNQDDPNNQIKHISGSQILNPNSTFSDGIGGFGSNVVFIKFEGITYNTGTIAITDAIGSGGTKYITVSETGQIE